MRQQWQVYETGELSKTLARAVGIHPWTAQCLINRGAATFEEARRFLEPQRASLRNGVFDAACKRLVERLKSAIARRQSILIFSDSDVDGLTASVILYEAIERLGGKVHAVPSNRIEDGYGIPDSLVARIARSDYGVIVLVDCGTNQPEAVDKLEAAGLEVLIVDHHLPLEDRAQPRVLFNPHCDSEPGGRELCSAGLAFCAAGLLLEERPEALQLELADLAALGTLADYSPMRGENRRILALGLPRLMRTARPGLKRLCLETQISEASPEQILKKLIPRLNASGRLGDASAVWHLLHAADGDHDQWMAVAGEAHETTKQLQRQIVAQAQEQVNRLHFKDQYVLVVSRAGWHQGLMGPLAAQLSQQYGRPAFAIAVDEEQATGSGRSIPALNLLEVLKGCQQVLTRFGGHSQACGLTLDRKHLDSFRALVNLQAKAVLGNGDLAEIRRIDLELSLAEITPSWVEELERLAPFGQGNPRPSVLLRDVVLNPQSSRIATLRQKDTEALVRGTLAGVLPGEHYDVVVGLSITNRQMRLSLSGARRCEAL